MKELFLVIAMVAILPTVAPADQDEIDADLAFYGHTHDVDLECDVEVVNVSPGVKKIYIKNELAVTITRKGSVGYIDSVFGGEQMFKPKHDKSVEKANLHIASILAHYGVTIIGEHEYACSFM